MTPAQAIHKFEHLRRFTRDGERAVHKPLLALLILGRIANGQRAPVEKVDAATPKGFRHNLFSSLQNRMLESDRLAALGNYVSVLTRELISPDIANLSIGAH